jgi:hypothetical protein
MCHGVRHVVAVAIPETYSHGSSNLVRDHGYRWNHYRLYRAMWSVGRLSWRPHLSFESPIADIRTYSNAQGLWCNTLDANFAY